MLERNFKSADELGLREVEHEALIRVLGLLERGELDDRKFNMKVLWVTDDQECGSRGCLCGWAYSVSGGLAFPEVGTGRHTDRVEMTMRMTDELRDLFWMRRPVLFCKGATIERTAEVLRDYLTTGKSTWTHQDMGLFR
jgi:hypothetical protein